MMRGSAWLVPLVPAILMLATTTATAAYDAGSMLEADDPIRLQGRGEAVILQGLAAIVTDGSAPGVSMTAGMLWVEHYQQGAAACAPTSLTCSPSPAMSKATVQVRDAQLTVTPLGGGAKLLVTNEPEHLKNVQAGRGAIVAGLGGASTLTATQAAQFLSGQERGWTSTARQAEPVYAVDARTIAVAASNVALTADGDFEALLQGYTVRVQGTNMANGARYDQTFEARAPSSTGFSYVVVEARDGRLNAHVSGQLQAFALDSVKVLEQGSATFARPTGRVVTDGTAARYDAAAQPLSLAAPLALRDLEVIAGTPTRIRASISSDVAGEPPAKPLQQMAAAAAAGAGGAGLLAAAVYFWPRLKYATTLAVLPLYSRIERSQVLDHAKRDEIYELIRASPGIHAHEIGERARIGWGTTVYHLKMLEGHSLVVSKKSGRYKRFYVNTGEYTKKKDVYAALRNDTAKSIAEYVFRHAGTSQKEMCEALGIQPSLASWHVDKLEAVGLVKRVKDGRLVRYYAGPAWSDLPGGVGALTAPDGAANA